MFRRSFAAIAAAVLVAGCADARQPAANEPGRVARFEIVSGNEQIGTPGDELPQPLTARALDASGNPVPGRQIALKVTDGGGSMFVGGGVTNANGIVKDYWTLGTVAGTAQRVEARTVDPETGERQVVGTFTAQALTETPNGNAPAVRLIHYPAPYATQNGLVGRVQPIPFRVVATDRFGNVLRRAGIAVHWTASGNGRVNAAETLTDSTGVTGARWWFATTPGPQTLTATLGGATQPVVFNGMATPGPVTSLVVEPANPRFTALNDTIRMSATATDVYGNPWPITWTLPNIPAVEFAGTPPRLRSRANGDASFIVSAGSQADTIFVVVKQVPVTATFRSSFPAVLPRSSVLRLPSTVAAIDANGYVVSFVEFSFTMSDPTIGTIDAAGVFRPSRSGTVRFTATGAGFTVTSPVLTVQ